MPQLLTGLAVLACPVGMGLMMWLMARGRERPAADSATSDHSAELARLRAEIDQLQAAQRGPAGSAAGDGAPTGSIR